MAEEEKTKYDEELEDIPDIDDIDIKINQLPLLCFLLVVFYNTHETHFNFITKPVPTAQAF